MMSRYIRLTRKMNKEPYFSKNRSSRSNQRLITMPFFLQWCGMTGISSPVRCREHIFANIINANQCLNYYVALPSLIPEPNHSENHKSIVKPPISRTKALNKVQFKCWKSPNCIVINSINTNNIAAAKMYNSLFNHAKGRKCANKIPPGK